MPTTHEQMNARRELWRNEILDPERDEELTPLIELLKSLEKDTFNQGINHGIRIAAQLVKDHVLSDSTNPQAVYDFLVDRANRVITLEAPQ